MHKWTALLLLIGLWCLSPANGDSVYGNLLKLSTLRDDDKDGVINKRDHCPNTPRKSQVDNNGCPSQSKSILSTELKILFDSGKYEVKPRFYSEIKKLADFLKENPGSEVRIEGYTDNIGNDQSNQILSYNRAMAIADILVDSFKISRSRVKAVGYGEERPIADNDTPQGRSKNRRVVAEVFASKIKSIEKWTIYSVDKNIQ